MDFNLVTLWHGTSFPGKAVLVILGIMGVYMLAVGVERWLTFSKARARSLEFVLNLGQRLRDHNLKGAFDLAQAKPQSPISIVNQPNISAAKAPPRISSPLTPS